MFSFYVFIIENSNSFEITKARAKILGLKHSLVDLYQDCLNDVLGIKIGTPQRSFLLGINMRKIFR